MLERCLHRVCKPISKVLMSRVSRALLHFLGCPQAKCEADEHSCVLLGDEPCFLAPSARFAAAGQSQSLLHAATTTAESTRPRLLFRAIGKCDSRAPCNQVLPVLGTALPAVCHPACSSPPSAKSFCYFVFSSRIILQVTMFFLCSSRTKHFF